MRRLSVLFLLCCLNTAHATEPTTKVYVLGMIHSGHLTSEMWGVEQVAETIRAIDPDVICIEIPPANWPSALATWGEKHIVEDSRVKVFPEYVDVLLPLSDEMDFVVEPCAGWTRSMATARRARIEEFETSAADSLARMAYEEDEAWVSKWLKDSAPEFADDDPFYIHSPLYDLRSKAELGPYEFHLNDVIGPPGGWTYINEEHFALIAAAIEKHAGQNILITFGAGHKYWFLEKLREMADVELVDVRAFLPVTEKVSAPQSSTRTDALLESIEELGAWRIQQVRAQSSR
ncbi:MAG: hypothetical protein ACI9UQ_000232 [Candidatus Krumholzibacteriia bacterium]|jgi:hypothetical protein